MIELFNEDCYKVMEDLINKNTKIDAIITDPPYILEKHQSNGNDEISKAKRKVSKEIDFIIEDFDYKKCFNMFLELMPIPNFIMFCSNKQISRTMSFFEDRNFSTTLLTWYKTNAIPACGNGYKSDLEYIVYVRGKGAHFNDIKKRHKSRLFSMPFVAGVNRLHPTEKPLKLMLELVNTHSLEGDTVFDPFMGSGTTGEACKMLKRNFIGSELVKDFYEKANNRINSLLL